MFAICPSCWRFLGRRAPLEQADVVDEVCRACALRPEMAGGAVLVVSRLRADTLAILRALLETAPEFQVVLDRRAGARVPAGAGFPPVAIRVRSAAKGPALPGSGVEVASSFDATAHESSTLLGEVSP